MSYRFTTVQVFRRSRSYGTLDFLIRFLCTVAIIMSMMYIGHWHRNPVQFKLWIKEIYSEKPIYDVRTTSVGENQLDSRTEHAIH